jgi:hypothetical protein
MRRFENGEALAKEMGIAPAQLEKTFETYNSIADGKIKDPWGKRFFHNVPIKMSDYFYVALMQPVLHYTMVRIYIYKRVFLVLIIFETYCLVIIV